MSKDLTQVDLEAELERLAERYRGANGPAIQILNRIAGSAETLLDRLPEAVRGQLDSATRQALEVSLKAASSSRQTVPDQSDWMNRVINTSLGAVGGIGGLPSALAELPFTTTMLMRIIEGIAVEYGFDPTHENVQFDCLQVFGAAGPLEHDDGADLGFIAVRTGLPSIIARVAPRLGAVLGQKVAAQSVPVLGAVAGAATNFAYTSYYQDIAHVHFGLRKLAVDVGKPEQELVEMLRARMLAPPVS
jgi:hypothetical protein